MSTRRRSKLDSASFVVFVVAAVFTGISILSYVAALAVHYIHLGPPEITLVDIGNAFGALAAIMVVVFIITAGVQEWRHARRKRK